jgi:hypothetical protein
MIATIEAEITHIKPTKLKLKIDFCRCFLPKCKCKPTRFWVATKICKVRNKVLQTGKNIIEIPLAINEGAI